jgi:hypothetical protein
VPGEFQTRIFDAPREALPDDRKPRIIELLGLGRQANVPPSVHPETGQRRQWFSPDGRVLDRPGEPAQVDPDDLLAACGRLAAAALLAVLWPRGQRQDVALALAGWLLRAGWQTEDVEGFLAEVCRVAGDEELKKRLQTGEYTRRRLEAARPATGFPRLRELLGPAVADRLAEWLNVSARDPEAEAGGRGGAGGSYFTAAGGTFWAKPTREGPVPVQLANFTAAVLAVVTLDDGAEQVTEFEVEAVLEGRRRRGRVPAGKFSNLGWALELLGPKAVIAPGQSLRDHLRAAIQILSPEPAERRIFAHTGWRTLGNVTVFLHAGGALGPDGPVPGVEVELPEELSGFSLPAPPSGPELQRAVRTVLGLLELAPARITGPLLAAPFTAPLLDCDFAIHLAGPTGVFKTELAALVQQFFGPGLDARHLPASWASTANALEDLAFRAKDVVLVVDDFAPTGPAWIVAQLHREADRLLRAAGNRLGRLRMRSDATLRPARPPRGLIVSTGEDIPRGQSLRARLWVVEVSPGEVSAGALSRAQIEAAAGTYASALAGFLAWLAADLEGRRAGARARAQRLRDEARSTPHPRTPDIAGKLGAGLRLFLQFAVEVGALSPAGAEEAFRRAWDGILEGMAGQAAAQEAQEPARRFIELLGSAVASGEAHLASPDGDSPINPAAWGWREVTVGTGGYERTEWRPMGRRVGWVDGGDVYLDPDAALRAAQEMARASGDGLAIGVVTLGRRLREAGILRSADLGGHTTVRRVVEGRLGRVWVLPGEILLSGYPTNKAVNPVNPNNGNPGEAKLVEEEW